MLLAKSIDYNHSEIFGLKAVDLEIKQGEIVGLIGPNGSGKSTFLRLLSRLLTPESGEIVLDGKSIQQVKSIDIAKQLAMLPQMNEHRLDITVRDLIEFGRHPHKNWFDRMNQEDEDIIRWALSLTKLEKYEHRALHSLSGGERQRAWIAMAIAQRPKILLLDEPTTYLDIAHQLEVMELVQTLNREFGMTVVMVLHDINQAAQYSDRLIVMKDGAIEYDGNPQCVLCKNMFQHIFDIDVDIYNDGEKPFFTPKRICVRKDACENAAMCE
ncbi:ABC transporter ATP-binding protein [Priestia taiwanensis]|uniref:Iron ABC transporter ATP-binding protein n=1 Tax=Priestia taiwanensis TaxID=1347902 RepID=A0A917AS16_9BACI|nr:ABC transporter ATP-binding protein [Priestia taiwanensis]MBM7363918.1 iron complex transport system ATP-binding protein [Priestia taiwanensis]GGE70092.1 iron ABC transporter ATP-binding protein [Priestia taiwanensis]